MNYMIMPGLPKKTKLTPLARNRDYVLKQLLIYFDITMPELTKKSRKRKVVQIRYIIFYYLYTLTNMTLQEITDIFKPAIGDHSTVIYGIQFVRDQIGLHYDTEINEHIKKITI